MTENKQFMQLQANVLNKKIEVRAIDTSWGVAKGVLLSQGIPIESVHSTPELYIPEPSEVGFY